MMAAEKAVEGVQQTVKSDETCKLAAILTFPVSLKPWYRFSSKRPMMGNMRPVRA